MDVIQFDDGFDANFGEVSTIRLKMAEYERIRSKDGGDCGSNSYLLQRFDPTIFMVTNETHYTSDVKALTYNVIILFQNALSSPLLIRLDVHESLRCRSTAA